MLACLFSSIQHKYNFMYESVYSLRVCAHMCVYECEQHVCVHAFM